jgi:UDP-2,3-diacylglucosamine pyrophosphatase LpxH
MSGKAVVAISDLHLGRRNPQDSFVEHPDLVRGFARRLAKGSKESGTELTVILNGDVFDLWEIVSDEELDESPKGRQAIATGLRIPVRNANDLAGMTDSLRVKLNSSLRHHREFGDFMQILLSNGIPIHINVGNHDHQLDNAASVPVLIEALRRNGVPDASDGTVKVGRFFKDDALRFYAEHGDQFAEDSSRSPLGDPNAPVLDEAPGFYFLRYIWNRLENVDPELPQDATTGRIIGMFTDMILGNLDGPLDRLRTFSDDYFTAAEQLQFPIVNRTDIKFLHSLWKARRITIPLPQMVLLNYEPDEVFETGREGIIEAAPQERLPLKWLPGLDLQPQPCKEDRFVKGLRGRFEEHQDVFPRLKPSDFTTVTIGHTHREGQWKLFQNPDVVYLNTGSWTRGHVLAYAWAFTDGKNQPVSGLRHLFG